MLYGFFNKKNVILLLFVFFIEKKIQNLQQKNNSKNNEINNVQYVYNDVGEIRRVVLLHNLKSLKYTINPLPEAGGFYFLH